MTLKLCYPVKMITYPVLMMCVFDSKHKKYKYLQIKCDLIISKLLHGGILTYHRFSAYYQNAFFVLFNRILIVKKHLESLLGNFNPVMLLL